MITSGQELEEAFHGRESVQRYTSPEAWTEAVYVALVCCYNYLFRIIS